MVHYNRRLIVAPPQAEVFAYLSRFSSAAEWDPGTTSAAMVTPEPVGLGSAFQLETVFMGNTVPLRYEITEFDPPRLVALSAENSSVRGTDTITISAHPSGGSVVDYSADLALKGVAKLFAPVFAIAFRRIGDKAADGMLATLGAPPGQSQP
ncbi:MAG: SRPBCC family protein [Mycobacteriales bacterium]